VLYFIADIPNKLNRYFEGGVSSVYLWDLDDGGFAGVVLMKKSKFFNLLSSQGSSVATIRVPT
jgi:F-actin capping protein, beta subunit.